MTEPLVARIHAVTLAPGPRGWVGRLRPRIGGLLRAGIPRWRRRRQRRGRVRSDVFIARLALRLVRVRRPRPKLVVERVLLATPTPAPRGHGSEQRPVRMADRAERASRVARREVHLRSTSTLLRSTSVQERRTHLTTRLDTSASRLTLERVERTRKVIETPAMRTVIAAPEPAFAMTHRVPTPARSAGGEGVPLALMRPAQDLAFADPRSSAPERVHGATLDVERLTDQVLFKIERRLIAQRERMGIASL
jgi:hypothetical protein